jgi:6-phosphogluconolactonase (cycloisomerase 2 family)
VVNPDAKTIAGFSVDQSTGALTPLTSSPTTVTGPPVALAIDSQARFAYVGMRGQPDVLVTCAIDRQTGADPRAVFRVGQAPHLSRAALWAFVPQ